MSSLPQRSTPLGSIVVKSIVRSRYDANARPPSWDQRVSGLDEVLTTDGTTVSLQSDGQQSPPQPGWELVLTGGDSKNGFTWTLFGMKSVQ